MIKYSYFFLFAFWEFTKRVHNQFVFTIVVTQFFREAPQIDIFSLLRGLTLGTFLHPLWWTSLRRTREGAKASKTCSLSLWDSFSKATKRLCISLGQSIYSISLPLQTLSLAFSLPQSLIPISVCEKLLQKPSDFAQRC